eukprot:1996626-Prymnesium_polylepis.2
MSLTICITTRYFVGAFTNVPSSGSAAAPTGRFLQSTQPGICQNTCIYPADGLCDDGGPGSAYADCTYGHDCTDCGSRPYASPAAPPLPPSPPPPSYPPPDPPSLPGICRNTCLYPADGFCDDGGAGSNLDACTYGHDCTDCSSRHFYPSSPPLPPGTPPPPSSPLLAPGETRARCLRSESGVASVRTRRDARAPIGFRTKLYFFYPSHTLPRFRT